MCSKFSAIFSFMNAIFSIPILYGDSVHIRVCMMNRTIYAADDDGFWRGHFHEHGKRWTTLLHLVRFLQIWHTCISLLNSTYCEQRHQVHCIWISRLSFRDLCFKNWYGESLGHNFYSRFFGFPFSSFVGGVPRESGHCSLTLSQFRSSARIIMSQKLAWRIQMMLKKKQGPLFPGGGGRDR